MCMLEHLIHNKKMTFSLKCTHAHIHYLFPPRAPCSGPKLQLAPFFESYFVCSLATYYNRYSITINTCYEIGITLGVIKLFGNQTPKFGASGAADFFLALLKLFNFAYGSQQMSYWEHFLLKWFRSPKLWTGAWWSHILICDQRLSPGGQSSWITD